LESYASSEPDYDAMMANSEARRSKQKSRISMPNGTNPMMSPKSTVASDRRKAAKQNLLKTNAYNK
jgi:hypothetical protein